MPHPAGRTEDRNSTLPALASLRLPDEEAIDWGDGTVWFVSWLDDHDAYHAGRWYDPDEFRRRRRRRHRSVAELPRARGRRLRLVRCGGGGHGWAASRRLRARLEREAAANPSHDVGTGLGRGPLDHKWDLHCCGPAPDLDAAHRPHLTGR